MSLESGHSEQQFEERGKSENQKGINDHEEK